MIEGTKLVKMWFWLLKIIVLLNCLITVHYVNIYLRAFVNVDRYRNMPQGAEASICVRFRYYIYKVNRFTDKNEE